MLLSTAHFPPIQYFSKIIDSGELILEARENYQRQSYRNRFIILGANGTISLSVPVIKGHSPGQPVKDVKIDYSGPWQRIHFKTLFSAYSHSPFFEFYIDDLSRFWKDKWSFLYDLNLAALESVIEILGIETSIIESDKFTSPDDLEFDYREIIHPKCGLDQDPFFKPFPYTQNFSDRHGFIPNLSIIDLLFQAGPESLSIIKKSIH